MRDVTLSFALIATAACAQNAPAPLPYDLAQPAHAFDLPAELREVSALTCVDQRTIACVQDEKGILYLLDATDGRIRAAHHFGPKGDYEGLARMGRTYFVLRSDGMLLQLRPRGTGWTVAEAVALDTPHKELEGLCHDPALDLLLVAPKDVPPAPTGDAKPDKEARKQAADTRVVYGFDPRTRKLLADPVLRLSRERLVRQAGDDDELPRKDGKKGKGKPDLELRFSCVAVHPTTHDVWLLSAVDHVVFAVTRAGDLHHIAALPREAFPRAEGMTFLPDGSLVLSSEGEKGPGRVFVYAPLRR